MRHRGGGLRAGALGLVFACVLLEIGLRLLYRGGPAVEFDVRARMQSSRYVSHPFLPYAGRPNGSWTLTNGPDGKIERIDTNSYGFRTHEFPRQKQREDYVVLCLGESSTFGYQVESNEKTWPALLEKQLADTYPKRRIQVFNLGIDMATTAVSVVNMALIGVHLRPDLVIVYQAFNDLSALGYADERTDHSHFYRDLCPEDLQPAIQSHLPAWLLDHSYLILHLTGALDLLATPNDLLSLVRKPRIEHPDRMNGLEATLANLKTLHSIAAGRQAQIVFSTFQFRDFEGEAVRMNDALRTFYEDNEFLYVDQDRLIPDGDPSINVDVCHLTPKGEAMLTRNFYDFIVAHHLVPADPPATAQQP